MLLASEVAGADEIIAEWTKTTPMLASGAAFRRERLAGILKCPIETCSVPDEIERAA